MAQKYQKIKDKKTHIGPPLNEDLGNLLSSTSNRIVKRGRIPETQYRKVEEEWSIHSVKVCKRYLSVAMRENICRFSSFSQIDYNMAGGQWVGSITVSRKVPLLWNLSCLHLALCRFLHFGQWRFLHLFAGSEGQDLKSQRCRHMLWSLSLRPILVFILSVWPQLCWCFAKCNSTTTVLEGFTLKHWANIVALFWNKKNPWNFLIYE